MSKNIILVARFLAFRFRESTMSLDIRLDFDVLKLCVVVCLFCVYFVIFSLLLCAAE